MAYPVFRVRSRARGLALGVSFLDVLQQEFAAQLPSAQPLDQRTAEQFAASTVDFMMQGFHMAATLSEDFFGYVSRFGGHGQVLAVPGFSYDLLLYVAPFPLARAYLRDASRMFPQYQFWPVVGVTPENFFASLDTE